MMAAAFPEALPVAQAEILIANDQLLPHAVELYNDLPPAAGNRFF